MFNKLLDKIHDPPEFTSFKVFQFLGYFFGGIGPVIIFFMIELYGWEQNVMGGQFIGRFILLTLLGAVVGIVAFYIEHVYNEKHWLFGLFFLLQAIFSIGFIHLLVAYTGGPTSSIFAFSYLYLPAVVGFCYGKGFKLWMAIAFLSTSFIFNLFWREENLQFFNCYLISGKSFCSDLPISNLVVGNKLIYLITFGIQIGVTGAIASKRRTSKEPDVATDNQKKD